MMVHERLKVEEKKSFCVKIRQCRATLIHEIFQTTAKTGFKDDKKHICHGERLSANGSQYIVDDINNFRVVCQLAHVMKRVLSELSI